MARQKIRCKYYPECTAESDNFSKLLKHSKEVHNDSQPFSCNRCDYTASKFSCLKFHLFSHVGFKKFECGLCPKSYLHRQSLLNHMFASHRNVDIKTYDCSYCGKKFTMRSKLRDHMRTHVPAPEKTKCHICSKEHPSNAELRVHYKNHYRTKCHICSKKYATKTGLRKHLLSGHTKPKIKWYDCSYCDKKFPLPWRLKHHMRIHSPAPGATKCHICAEEHPSNAELRVHFKSHFTTKCHVCSKEYLAKEALKHHILSCHKEVNIKSHDCSYCGRKFVSTYKLKYHMRTHLPAPEATKCQICSEEHPSNAELRVHFKSHFTTKCHLCSKEYLSREALKKHLLSSHKEGSIKSHDCSYCDKKFFTLTDLKWHLRKHSYISETTACHLCPKTFLSQTNLYNHFRTHDITIKWLKCSLCPERFAKEINLKRHLISIHKEIEIKTYDCHLCGKLFRTSRGHDTHLKVHVKCPTKTLSLQRYKCQLCPKQYASKMRLKKHIVWCHKEASITTHSCPYCSSVYFTKSGLDKHVSSHALTSDKCQIDSEEVSSPTSLETHLKSDDNELKCRLCEMQCGTKKELTLHSLSHHLKRRLTKHFPTPVVPVVCQICCEEFESSATLTAHIRSHYKMPNQVNIRTYDSSHCDKNYSTPGRLKCHIRRDILDTLAASPENEPESHKETLLPISTSESSNDEIPDETLLIPSIESSIEQEFEDYIRAHQSVQLDKKRHDCQDCGQTFMLETSLQKHHDPAKKTENLLCCKKCPKTFQNLNCFTYHERSHREFLCEVCKKKCYTPQGFKVHLKTHGIA